MDKQNSKNANINALAAPDFFRNGSNFCETFKLHIATRRNG
jgi:hypothetical protein